jgi:hypothetical protein
MNLEEFAVDPNSYENGRRVQLSDDAYVGVRAAGSKRAQEVHKRLWSPYKHFRKDVPPDVVSKLNAHWVAEGLLTEMSGFSVGGKPIDADFASEEDCKRLGRVLTDRKYIGFVGRVMIIAYEDTNFQDAADSVTEKNSATSPAGSSASGEAPSS